MAVAEENATFGTNEVDAIAYMEETTCTMPPKVEANVDEEYNKYGVGHFNVLICGRTGVGKSTLMVNILPKEQASRLAEQIKIGRGVPGTKCTTEYKVDGYPMSYFDTRGIEKEANCIKEIKNLIKFRSNEVDENKRIHMVWLCVNKEDDRFQDVEQRFVDEMVKLKLPFVIVITKAYNKNQNFRNKVIEISKLPDCRVVQLLAEDLVEDGTNKTLVKAYGLQALLSITMDLIPEAAQKGLAAAQNVDIKWKKIYSATVVTVSAASAGAVGFTPVPFVDAAIIVPIQIAMIAGITAVFGFKIKRNQIISLLALVFTTGGGWLLGRTIVTELLKLVPFAGWAVGGSISAATGSAITAAFGGIYIEVLAFFWERDRKQPTFEQITEKFKELYRGRTSLQTAGNAY